MDFEMNTKKVFCFGSSEEKKAVAAMAGKKEVGYNAIRI